MTIPVRKYLASSLSKVDIPEVYILQRWLNLPNEKKYEVEKFFPHIEKYWHPDLVLASMDTELVFYFREGNNSNDTFYLTFGKSKSSPFFFTFTSPDIENSSLNFLFSGNDNPNQGILFKLGTDIINVDTLSLLTPVAFTQKIDLLFHSTIGDNELNAFIPQVTEISLLNTVDLLENNDTFKENYYEYFELLSCPDITRLPNLSIAYDFPMLEYKNFSIDKPNISGINKSIMAANVVDNYQDENIVNQPFSEIILKLLHPVTELSKELQEDILVNLPNFQKVGAKFLFDSKFALIHDQFELGKELQTVMALKMLLRIRAVKKVLIITSEYKERIFNTWNDEIFTGLWQYYLKLFLPDFAFRFYSKDIHLFTESSINNQIVTGLTYEYAEECIMRGTLTSNMMNSFDCIIFDDIDNSVPGLDCFKLSNKSSDYTYRWFLTDFNDVNTFTSIQKLYPDLKLDILGREVSDCLAHMGSRFNFDYYLPLNGSLAVEVKKVFEEGKETLDDVIGLGNLFRFRPNVFGIFQQEQQVVNRSSANTINQKLSLLEYHIKRILNREEKVLIYSQYYTDGLSEIMKKLDALGIHYMKIKQADSLAEQEIKIQKGYNDGINVFLTNLKPNGVKFCFKNITNLINYDNWWNPITRWDLEQKLEQVDDRPLTVYNYYYNDTIESSLNMRLNIQGLRDKLVLDILPAEHMYNIFNEADWCNLFDIQSELFTKKPTSPCEIISMKELVEHTKALLVKLGLSGIETTASIKDCSFTVVGHLLKNEKRHSVKAKCFYAKHLSTEFLNNQIKEISTTDNSQRQFFITNGTISRSNVFLPDNLCLISGKILLKYLEVL